MTLIDQMRRKLSEARACGKDPDHWEISPDALARVKDEARPGDLVGGEYSGEWALDGLALKESNIPGDADDGILLVTIRT